MGGPSPAGWVVTWRTVATTRRPSSSPQTSAEGHQRVERRAQRLGVELVAERSAQVGQGGRLGKQAERLEDAVLGPVEQVERPQHRRPGGGPGGEHGDVGRHRADEVGAHREHRGEVVVGALTQPLGDATCGRTSAHPDHGSAAAAAPPNPRAHRYPRTVLTVGFDLDMTLIDSRAGVKAAMEALSAKTGVHIDADLVVTRLGPPLETELARWFPAWEIESAAVAYREFYATTCLHRDDGPARRPRCF